MASRIRWECRLCDKFIIRGDDEAEPDKCPFCKTPNSMFKAREVVVGDA